jgi:hypothetical protein
MLLEPIGTLYSRILRRWGIGSHDSFTSFYHDVLSPRRGEEYVEIPCESVVLSNSVRQ